MLLRYFYQLKSRMTYERGEGRWRMDLSHNIFCLEMNEWVRYHSLVLTRKIFFVTKIVAFRTLSEYVHACSLYHLSLSASIHLFSSLISSLFFSFIHVQMQCCRTLLATLSILVSSSFPSFLLNSGYTEHNTFIHREHNIHSAISEILPIP